MSIFLQEVSNDIKEYKKLVEGKFVKGKIKSGSWIQFIVKAEADPKSTSSS